MVINGMRLYCHDPMVPMVTSKIYGHGVTHGLGEAGYDIRIDQTIVFDRTWYGRRRVTRYKRPFSWGESERFFGRFVLGSSMERFTMPTGLLGIVHDKSSWAREGLSVFNTVIEPGWSGYLTLELVYHGRGTLEIPAGAGIAQVIFHQVSNPVTYKGRYQNQNAGPVERIHADDVKEAA